MPIKNNIAHVHAEFIKGWADGYAIEFRPHTHASWGDVGGTPAWNPDFEYRFKAEPEFYTEECHVIYLPEEGRMKIVPGWKNNLRLTFNASGLLVGVDQLE
jgi:hypothetical protein